MPAPFDWRSELKLIRGLIVHYRQLVAEGDNHPLTGHEAIRQELVSRMGRLRDAAVAAIDADLDGLYAQFTEPLPAPTRPKRNGYSK